MKKMLIIEDDLSIAMALEDDFNFEGYEVTVKRSGRVGLSEGLKGKYDIIILDIMLPEINGFEICKIFRSQGIKTPVIMLTAKSQEIDKVLGLEIGADDYVTKPFSPRELQARVKALLRRTSRIKTQPELNVIQIADLEINYERREVKRNGLIINLTALEFDLLKLFIENKEKVMSRNRILEEIWGEHVIVDYRTVDAHVAKIRKKLENDPAQPKLIIGVRGVGYKLSSH